MSEKLDFIQETLNSLPFVEWDRYTEYWINGVHWVKPYGWIEREKDQYKDFAFLEINLTDFEVHSWMTSSEKHHSDFVETLDEEDDESNECKRIEDLPVSVNAVELNKQVTVQ